MIDKLNKFIPLFPEIRNPEQLSLHLENSLLEVLGADKSAVYLCIPPQTSLKLYSRSGIPETGVLLNNRIPESVSYVLQNSTELYIPSEVKSTDLHQHPFEPSIPVRSSLLLPLLSGEKAIGVVVLGSFSADAFTEELLVAGRMLMSLASSVLNAIIQETTLSNEDFVPVIHKVSNKDKIHSLDYQQIVQKGPKAIAIMDEDLRIVEWNTEAENIFGFMKHEMMGRPGGNVLLLHDLLHSSGTTSASGEISGMQRNRFKTVGYKKSREEFPVDIIVSQLRSNSECFYCFYIRDISEDEKNKAELESVTSRLKTLIHNLEAGILMEDENRRIALINKYFCNIFKIPVEPEMMLGIDCTRAADQSGHMFGDPEDFSQRIIHIISEKKPVIGEELELPNGVFFERDYLPIFSGDKFIGHLWQYRDITGRKQVESSLKSAMIAAESASNAKSRFLANMSHEIRTPLNAIVGMIRLLGDTELSDNQQKLLHNLNVSSGNLLTIINDILDFSKIESGQMDLDESDFDLRELVQQVVDSMEYKATEKKITLNSIIDPSIGSLLIGDAPRLHQVLNNLASNAIKFTLEGKVEIRCSLLRSDDKIQSIEFSVEDTGIGINPENLGKIFESFQQEDESITRLYGGTGLGLAISNQLVRLMGGTLKVNTTKGVGSKFYFTLDLPIGFNEIPGPLPYSISELFSLKEIKVLLVEDNKFNQFIAKALLDKWGAETVIAENGRHAVDILKETSFDLVLMDLQMPVMDGITAAGIIRNKLELELPILALTANVVKGIVEKCESAGMNGYISKPFDPDDFYQKIMMVLKNKILQLITKSNKT